jgi:hypothetical protein
LMTADLPYDRLINIVGNTNGISGRGMVTGDLNSFLLGLQHALIVLSALILVSAIFSALRGPRSENHDLNKSH